VNRLKFFYRTCAKLCAASVCVIASLAAQSYTIKTVAGTDFVGDGGTATSAILSQAEGIGIDAMGNIYIADAGDCRVRKIALDRTIETFAGTGICGFSGDTGPASLAQFNQPYGIALDASGNVYIADLGNARVRKVSTDGTISTVAGGGIIPAANGVEAASAQLNAPRNVAAGTDGSLYISDFGANRVYRVLPNGVLTVAAGSGVAGAFGDGSTATLAGLRAPAGIAVDPAGTLYIADSGNNIIRRVNQGAISTVFAIDQPTGVALGADGTLYVGAQNYIGTPAQQFSGAFGGALDLAVDAANNLYFTTGPLAVQTNSAGALTIVAGSGASRYYGGDGGPAASARLHAPSGIARDASGNWYIADSANNRVRMISPAGIMSTLAGTGDAGSAGDGGPALLAQLNNPRALAIDSGLNLFVADSGNHRVRKIDPSGIITTVLAGLQDAQAVLTDALGNLYIADAGAGHVLKFSATGVLSTIAVTQAPSALAFNTGGILLIATGSSIVELKRDGSLASVAEGLGHPSAIAVTPAGQLLVADSAGHAIWAGTLAGPFRVIAGTGVPGFSGDAGPAEQAQLNSPSGIGVDDTGTTWVADTGNNRIRTLVSSGDVGAISTVSIVNAASLQPGPVAPNEIVTIFGAGFDPASLTVSFGGQQATVFYANGGQINLLAPATLTPGAEADLDISSGGSPLASASVPITDAAPGLFTTDSGSGEAAAVNQDGKLNSGESPASQGSIVLLFGTGGGTTEGTISVTIGGVPADVLYGGPAPGFPGLMQINARVPKKLSQTGALPVTLSVGGAAAQSGVTIAVK
jgi:uncharacterized protein (TIGR03437 family)